MSEVDRYIGMFRSEADDLLLVMEETLLAIEAEPGDHDALDRLFRAVHTLKGSGAMFGFDDMARFAHHIETLMDKVRGGSVPVNRALIDLLLGSRDHIAALLAATAGGPPVDAAIQDALMARAGALAGGVGFPPSGSPAPAQRAPEAPPTERIFRIRFCPSADLFTVGCDPGLLLDELRALGELQLIPHVEGVAPLEQMDPVTCYVAWDAVLATTANQDAVRDVFLFVEDSSTVEIAEVSRADMVLAGDDRLPRLGDILVERRDITREAMKEALQQQDSPLKPVGQVLVEQGSVPPAKVASALAEQKVLQEHKHEAVQERLRVASDKLDDLVNIVGELVINQDRLNQLTQATLNKECIATTEIVGRLIAELRDVVLSIRMLPIGSAFGRFKRLVRDLSAELGKEIDLGVAGEETEMDKSVIDRLADPLVHLIRNSIDHGIERPEERERCGKPRRGSIRLIAAHQGTNVVISVVDDGRGLDTDAIRAKAVAQGLIGPEDVLSPRDIHNLIFAAGFSTAEKVTNVSGRGVGMDVVRREIEALRGTIAISSVPGRGSTIDLMLPLTLAIIDGLLVGVGDDRYVVPVSLIEECLELHASDYAMGTQRNVIKVREEPVPLLRLRELFGFTTPRPAVEEAVVVRAGVTRLAIVVDHVIGDFQTVIKPLNCLNRSAEGISGSTILGDGNVALILDVAGLLRLARREEDALHAAAA